MKPFKLRTSILNDVVPCLVVGFVFAHVLRIKGHEIGFAGIAIPVGIHCLGIGIKNRNKLDILISITLIIYAVYLAFDATMLICFRLIYGIPF